MWLRGPAGLDAHMFVLLSLTFMHHLLAVERTVNDPDTVQPS